MIENAQTREAIIDQLKRLPLADAEFAATLLYALLSSLDGRSGLEFCKALSGAEEPRLEWWRDYGKALDEAHTAYIAACGERAKKKMMAQNPQAFIELVKPAGKFEEYIHPRFKEALKLCYQEQEHKDLFLTPKE